MKYSLTLLILFFAVFPQIGSGQNVLEDDLQYGIYPNYPPLSITKDKLREASTLSDLNLHYKASWVRSYISVEVSVFINSEIKKAFGKNDTFTQAQKELMVTADPGSEISIFIKYIPENDLIHNDIRETKYTFEVNPEHDARYPGGSRELYHYLKENLIDNLPATEFRQYQLAVAKFTIDEEGQVNDPHMFWTSENEETDGLLLRTICNMPAWKPAQYADGTRVKQEFALTLGDMESCVIHLLNIRPDG